MTTIVLSTGGSGGHLFPAQALAGELARRGKTVVIMTDARGTTYQTNFPGSAIEIVPAATFADRSLLGRVATPLQILAGVGVSLAKLNRIRPSAVVGFGGYPSVPVMIAACLARFPTAILAPDAVLGRANRLVANYVRVIAAALPLVRFVPKDTAKIVYTGNPLRPDVIAVAGAPYRTPQADGPLKLLVFGGSQGARALSDLVPAALALLPEAMRRRLDVVQQCRPEDLEQVRGVYAAAQVKAELAPFFKDLPQRMADAQLVVARSGAGTVSELAAIGRPAILIPLPFALDDNQTPNADAMVAVGGGWRVAQRGLTPETLCGLIAAAFGAPDDLARRAAAARTLAKPDATARLADVVEQLARAA